MAKRLCELPFNTEKAKAMRCDIKFQINWLFEIDANISIRPK